MGFKFNLDCPLFYLKTFNERYVPDGYFDPMDVHDSLARTNHSPYKQVDNAVCDLYDFLGGYLRRI